MFHDCRLAVRNLLRQPGFSLLAVLTLALGIGATSAVYSVVDTVVLRPMPYPGGDRMRFISLRAPETSGGLLITPSLALAQRIAASVRSFEAVEPYVTDSRVTQGVDGAETISVVQVRPSLFERLGTRPHIGRGLVESDLAADAPNVALISHELWSTRFGADPSVLQQDIRLDDQLYRIIGVTRAGFRLPRSNHSVWVPLRADVRRAESTRRVTTLAVLRPDVTTHDAAAELQRLATDPADDVLLGRGFAPTVVEATTFISSTMRRSSLVLFAAVGVLLLMGCSNVAALLVTRNAARTREIAVRRALGATRLRLARLLLLEAAAIGASAGAGGVLIGMWSLEAARAMVPPRLVPVEAFELDGAVLVFAAAASAVTVLLFGLLPALQGSRVDLLTAMRSDARAGSLSPSRHFTRRALTVAEIGLAVLLLAGTGLLARSFVQLQRIPLGFDPHNTLSLTVELPESRYADEAAQRLFFDRLVEEAAGLPGVVAVARATGLPPDGGVMFGQMRILGRTSEPPHGPSTVMTATVSDEYFGVMRIPLRLGRTFDQRDTATAERVAMINETLARQLWPDGAIGQRFTYSEGANPTWTTVVGIVGDVKGAGLRGGGHGDYQVYYSARQSEMPFGSVVVRTTSDPASLAPVLRARVAEIDPRLPVESITTGTERVARTLAAERFNLLLLAVFAGLGLVLAATGIYGMMALYVAHRRHELGVRLALGATPPAVARLIFRQVTTMGIIGIAGGLASAIVLTRFMEALLYEVTPTDPLTFAAVVLVVSLIAVVATVIPVRRALQVEPGVALRVD